MKPKILILLILVLVIVALIFTIRFLASRSPKQGKLKVTSTPVASVFLDNKHVGRTPYEDKVNAGDVTVRVVPESTVSTLSSWQAKVTVAPNTLTFINRELTESELTSSGEVLWLEKITSKSSEIDVISNPDGASILLDDALKGVSPLTIQDVTAADHTLTVASPGFATKSLKIKTTAGYKIKVSMQLALSTGSPVPTPTVSTTPEVSIMPSGTPQLTPTPKISVTPSKSPTPTVTPRISPQASPTNPPKPYVVIKDTPTGYLRVRDEAGTSAAEVGRVNPGEKFSIQDSKEVNGVTWYQIKYDGANAGWVSGQYVEKVE